MTSQQSGIRATCATNDFSRSQGAERTEWEGLTPGCYVTIIEAERYSYCAEVEDLTADRTVVWVIHLGGAGRRAFHCADDVDIIPTEPSGGDTARPN